MTGHKCHPIGQRPYRDHSWQQYWNFETPPEPVPGKFICGLCHTVEQRSLEEEPWE